MLEGEMGRSAPVVTFPHCVHLVKMKQSLERRSLQSALHRHRHHHCHGHLCHRSCQPSGSRSVDTWKHHLDRSGLCGQHLLCCVGTSQPLQGGGAASSSTCPQAGSCSVHSLQLDALVSPMGLSGQDDPCDVDSNSLQKNNFCWH